MEKQSVYTRESPSFELELRIKNDDFLPTLQDFQQDWLVNKLMNEAARDWSRLPHCHAGLCMAPNALPCRKTGRSRKSRMTTSN
ncbi:MAG: hypothetical protein HZT40_06135 [Candidatus Thiothrix singaporensis]|uniref:Uncharacterized protein n=1 Tax=Candidatus Thiothrix singaporensis TaxID=2799669 RepID=A0A7L6AQ73_9GAMM|nr:MAG: hypothetical protein HZT40_06135 [Candidatus Thiothrix singaporensis]